MHMLARSADRPLARWSSTSLDVECAGRAVAPLRLDAEDFQQAGRGRRTLREMAAVPLRVWAT